MKKIQQAIAAPGVLERFVDDVEVLKRLRRTFTGLYSLDDSEEGRQAILKVMVSGNFEWFTVELLFLVACTRLYNPLCSSVGRLVVRSV